MPHRFPCSLLAELRWSYKCGTTNDFVGRVEPQRWMFCERFVHAGTLKMRTQKTNDGNASCYVLFDKSHSVHVPGVIEVASLSVCRKLPMGW